MFKSDPKLKKKKHLNFCAKNSYAVIFEIRTRHDIT